MKEPYVPLPSGTIVLTVTPDSNVDYKTMSVIDSSLVEELKFKRGEPLPVEKDGICYVYEPDDLKINEHRLIHNGISHRILHRLTVG